MSGARRDGNHSSATGLVSEVRAEAARNHFGGNPNYARLGCVAWVETSGARPHVQGNPHRRLGVVPEWGR
jgi:hypothetical protein